MPRKGPRDDTARYRYFCAYGASQAVGAALFFDAKFDDAPTWRDETKLEQSLVMGRRI